METDTDRAHRAWRNAERIKKLSDNLIKVGPWGLGLDGVLAWVPVAGTVYSLGTGGRARGWRPTCCSTARSATCR